MLILSKREETPDVPTLTVGSWSRFLPLLKPKMAWRTALGLPLPLRMEASALACINREVD